MPSAELQARGGTISPAFSSRVSRSTSEVANLGRPALSTFLLNGRPGTHSQINVVRFLGFLCAAAAAQAAMPPRSLR